LYFFNNFELGENFAMPEEMVSPMAEMETGFATERRMLMLRLQHAGVQALDWDAPCPSTASSNPKLGRPPAWRNL